MPRFFVQPDQIKEDKIEITGQDVRHIRDVLRLDCNDPIEICNGQGIDFDCMIDQINQESIIAKVLSQRDSKSEPKTKVILFQSLIKGDKIEWVIQKSIEIGVAEIMPMQTSYCVSKMDQSKKSDAKVSRWNKIASSAAKQSGRGIIPKVARPITFAKALELCQKMDLGLIAYEKENQKNLRSQLQGLEGKTIGVFIGPEGGFTKEEILKAQGAGVKAITLGPRILRSETASITLLSNILYELGEMDL